MRGVLIRAYLESLRYRGLQDYRNVIFKWNESFGAHTQLQASSTGIAVWSYPVLRFRPRFSLANLIKQGRDQKTNRGQSQKETTDTALF